MSKDKKGAQGFVAEESSAGEERVASQERRDLGRRDFLRLSATAAVGLYLGGCDSDEGAEAAAGDAFNEDVQGDAGDIAEDTAGDIAGDTAGDTSSTLDTSGIEDTTVDVPSDADVEVYDGLLYPRGDERVFVASEAGPADPGAVDGGVETAFVPEEVPFDEGMFPRAVSSGMMSREAALLSTWAEESATLRVWRAEGAPGTVAMVSDQVVDPNDAGFHKHWVEGLAAGTWYHFAFFRAAASGEGFDARSRIGRFRTAFLENAVVPLTIAATTCTKDTYRPFEAISLMAQEDFDLFLHLGDMTYNDSARDLAGYRAFWERTLKGDEYQEILSKAGMYITWDDHEFSNNLDPEAMDPTRFAAAKQAFEESLPVELGENDRLWTSHRWGLTAEIFVLDCRTERLPSTREGDNPIYMSQEQMDWLKQGLADSPCRFKLLMNSVPAAHFPGAIGQVNQSDRWMGYEIQRQELIDHIVNENIHDVWFLSGDFHFGFITRLDAMQPERHLWEIAVGPGASFANPLPVLVEDNPRAFPEEVHLPPDVFRYWSSKVEVATFLTLDPVEGTIRVRFINGEDGEVLFDEVMHQTD